MSRIFYFEIERKIGIFPEKSVFLHQFLKEIKMKSFLVFSSIMILFSCSRNNLSTNVSEKNQEIQSNSNENITFSEVKIPKKLEYYYQNINFEKNGKDLYNELSVHTIAKHTNILSYKERHPFLKKADADLNNNGNIILMYSAESISENQINRVVNTEHVYPQSLLNSKKSSHGIGDLHHLRYCNSQINSDRGNRPFTNASGGFKVVNGNWYPGDEHKGDVARMILYLNLRYNEDFSKVSTSGVELFLLWNAQDPVSDLEINRNNEIEQAQGNRNPFIDNPYLATKIWQGTPAENLWK